jgi:hypothetical protein
MFHLDWKHQNTNVSEVHAASIFKVNFSFTLQDVGAVSVQFPFNTAAMELIYM